jgi:hypothetical protein
LLRSRFRWWTPIHSRESRGIPPRFTKATTPVKPRCDVLLLGSAYAPYGEPAERVRVSLRVGPMSKQFDVVGNRVWMGDMFSASATRPEPFTVMSFSYDTAFGGVDNLSSDPNQHHAHPSNPIGRGFFPRSSGVQIAGKPLPNTEEPGIPVDTPKGSYTPMGLGPIGRSWPPRPKYAGTYDQNWIDNIFPFLPPDFDERYYQSAPPDQQIDHLRGGEPVALLNLTPAGRTEFRLPPVEMPVTFFLKNYKEVEAAAPADTLIIEPDLERFTILWRASLPLRKNLFEVAQVVVGRMPSGWYRARELGKTYYRSLRDLDIRRAAREETQKEPEEHEM